MKVFISEYYKKLFGKPEPSNLLMNEDVTVDMPQFSNDENDMLTADFTEKEVYEAIS